MAELTSNVPEVDPIEKVGAAACGVSAGLVDPVDPVGLAQATSPHNERKHSILTIALRMVSPFLNVDSTLEGIPGLITPSKLPQMGNLCLQKQRQLLRFMCTFLEKPVRLGSKISADGIGINQEVEVIATRGLANARMVGSWWALKWVQWFQVLLCRVSFSSHQAFLSAFNTQLPIRFSPWSFLIGPTIVLVKPCDQVCFVE